MQDRINRINRQDLRQELYRSIMAGEADYMLLNDSKEGQDQLVEFIKKKLKDWIGDDDWWDGARKL